MGIEPRDPSFRSGSTNRHTKPTVLALEVTIQRNNPTSLRSTPSVRGDYSKAALSFTGASTRGSVRSVRRGTLL